MGDQNTLTRSQKVDLAESEVVQRYLAEMNDQSAAQETHVPEADNEEDFS